MESQIHLEPDPRTWPALAQISRDDIVWRDRPLQAWRALTRHELGVPEDKVIIAAGHQAGFWHPGILSKFLAAHAVVESIRRERAVDLPLVVDHEDNDCSRLDLPIQGDHAGVDVQKVQIAALTPDMRGLPTGEIPALDPLHAADGLRNPATESIRKGLRAIESSLRAHRRETSLARQMAEAVNDQLETSVSRPALLVASRLFASSFGREIIRVMRDDPDRCARTYNGAVAGETGDVRPLQVRSGAVELPLWRIDLDRRRRPVFDADLNSIDPARLRPRALLMTAIMRLAVCDLFIHGRGGIAYDRAMEKWIREWLGLPVCPMAMATADVYLPFPDADVVGEFEIQQALRAFQRALHDPTSHDGALSKEKRALLAAITAAPRQSRERRERFLAYHRWLEQEREHHAARIREANADVVRLTQLAANQAVMARRDWAFPLYPRETLDPLNTTIRARVAGRESFAIVNPGPQSTPGV